jgi:hypothetical protein
MGSLLPLSIVGVVVAFLVGILASFPVQGVYTTHDPGDERYSGEAVREAGRLFSGNYMSLIDEIASYQTNPDYCRAEQRRQDMVDMAKTMTGQFEDFSERMEGELDRLGIEDSTELIPILNDYAIK